MDVEIEGPFLRSAFNYDRNRASDESGLLCEDVSLAKQAFAEECDINTIVRRFGITGELPQGVRMPTYGDFTTVVDFQTAMNAIVSARESFEEMPADVRYRFHNDPAEFVDFCSDPANRAEAEKLGLVVPKAEVEPERPVQVVVVPSQAESGGDREPEVPKHSSYT